LDSGSSHWHRLPGPALRQQGRYDVMALQTPRRALRRAARHLRHQVGRPNPAADSTESAELDRVRARLERAEAKVARNKEQLVQMRARFRAALDLADADRLPDDLEHTIARVREENLTYLRPAYLRDLAQRVLDLER